MAEPASQLDAIQRELEEARARAHQMADLAGPRWGVRPSPAAWSVSECLIHLNLTSTAFLPRIREALDRAHRAGLSGRGPYRLDFWGWLLCRLIEPPYGMQVKTPPSFQPTGVEPSEKVLADFDRLQGLLLQCVRASDGLPLGRLKTSSPFLPRLRYNLYSTYRMVPAHQRRHLWQAERVLATLP